MQNKHTIQVNHVEGNKHIASLEMDAIPRKGEILRITDDSTYEVLQVKHTISTSTDNQSVCLIVDESKWL